MARKLRVEYPGAILHWSFFLFIAGFIGGYDRMSGSYFAQYIKSGLEGHTRVSRRSIRIATCNLTISKRVRSATASESGLLNFYENIEFS
jgi:hypothetical protein